MTAKEYLAELNTHLMSLSSEERENAVKFYEEYFLDAGPEKEQDVISELGKPYALAKSIISEQSEYSKSRSYAKYRESKGLDPNYGSAAPQGEPDVMPEGRPHTQYTAYNYGNSDSGSAANNSGAGNNTYNNAADSAASNYDTSYETYKNNYGSSSGSAYTSYSSPQSNNLGGLAVGLILGTIFGLPLLLLLIAFIACFGIGVAIAIIGAVAMFVMGIVGVFTVGGAGIIAIGLGVALLGAAFLLVVPTALGFGKLLPWIFKSIGKLFKKLAKGVL